MATEKRLIDANATIELLRSLGSRDYRREKGTIMDAMKMISHPEYTPTVDAVEVVHGYTIIADNPQKVLLDRKCGICDQLMLATDNYCPMCGARNEGEKIDGLLFADMEEIIDA